MKTYRKNTLGLLMLAGIILSLSFSTLLLTESKYRLIVFEGSDWCRNCILFERTVLSDADFTEYLNAESIELLRVDFPQRKKLDVTLATKNAQIADKYNFDGVYPTILLVNLQTKAYKKLNYKDEGATEFQQLLESIISELP